jgi:hypothetical protein
MRASVLLMVLPVVAACSVTTKRPDRNERAMDLAKSEFVALPDLAEELDLSYRGDKAGVLELSNPPDVLIFETDERRVWVNGTAHTLDRAPILRGRNYALTPGDARKIRAAFIESRTDRADPEPVAAVVPRSVFPRAWTPSAPSRAWSRIVIHHTATERDNCASIDRMHRKKGWDNGCGYHFVIGNGTRSGDGQIEVGNRWRRQIQGAHTRVAGMPGNFWNENGIGIVLVGNFMEERPSTEQMDALVELVRAIQARYGIPSRHIHGHGQVDATKCPGARFPWRSFKARLAR